MAKNIQWKQSTIDYDKLNKLTPRVLAASALGNLNVKSGRQLEISKMSTPKKAKASAENAKKGLESFENMSEEFKYKSRSKGGKISGTNAKKSGQHSEYRKAGANAIKAIKLAQTLEYKQKLYDLINLETFTTKDIGGLWTEFDHIKDDQMIRRWVTDTDFFECIGKIGFNKLYKKKPLKNK